VRHRRTGSPGSWLPRRRDLRGQLVDPGRVNIFERWESQAALETCRSSGPNTEQRPAMLTMSVQEYDIADVRPVFWREAE
jgi:quinol monooxygenase YgiN